MAACLIQSPFADRESLANEPHLRLLEFPRGGPGLVFQVRRFASASDASRQALAALTPRANIWQKAAIGEGLARAMMACDGRYGDRARKIEALVNASGDREIIRGFIRAILADRPAAPLERQPATSRPALGPLPLDSTLSHVLPAPLPNTISHLSKIEIK